jgi:hypothetical protein
MTWRGQVGLALTRLGNAITGGLAEESMSSRAWRAEGNRKTWGRITRPAIDAAAALLGDRGHCARAYHSDRNKPALPVIGSAKD